MYPPDGGVYPEQRSQTPLVTPSGPFTVQNNGTAPMQVIYPTARRLSRSKSAVRPPSRINVSIQDFYTLPPLETEAQRNYDTYDSNARLTSPVQRLLERSHTQPMMSMQSMPGNDMDPITRQYYHRHWNSKSPTLDSTLYRYGRAGGVWRHVRACVANTGTQIAFIDGTVKQEDNVIFPQQKYKAKPSPFFSGLPVTQRLPPPQKPKYRNHFSKHAREGFEYWYHEPKPIDLKPRMRFKARMVGLGY